MNKVLWSFCLFAMTFLLMIGCQTAPDKRVENLFPEGPDVSAFNEESFTSQNVQDQEDLKLTQPVFKPIPEVMNTFVQKWLDYFQGRGRKYMELYLSRSSKYKPLMMTLLKESGLPEDLIYVVFIESGFSSTARSHASAVGYWQFIKGTGRHYNLKINHFVDERRDPELSTLAAIDYFKSLYSLFGSWYLSLAAYNAGENRIKSAVMRNQTRDFWQLAYQRQLPVETINYIPKFLAARLIAKNPQKYGFTEVAYEPALEYIKWPIEQPVDLSLMAKHSDIAYTDIKSLNASALDRYLPVFSDKQQYIKLPVQKEDILQAALSNSYVSHKKLRINSIRYHRVRRGETVSHIARRFGTTAYKIKSINSLGRRYHIRAGQVLKIPTRHYQSPRRPASGTLKKSKKKNNRKNIHIVKRGETLFGISRKYRVSVAQIANVNALKNRSLIHVGKRLVIPD